MPEPPQQPLSVLPLHRGAAAVGESRSKHRMDSIAQVRAGPGLCPQRAQGGLGQLPLSCGGAEPGRRGCVLTQLVVRQLGTAGSRELERAMPLGHQSVGAGEFVQVGQLEQVCLRARPLADRVAGERGNHLFP